MSGMQTSGLLVTGEFPCKAGCGMWIETPGLCPECREQDLALDRAFEEAQQRKAARRAYREALLLKEQAEKEDQAARPMWQQVANAVVTMAAMGLVLYVMSAMAMMFVSWIKGGGSPWQ